MPKYPQPCRDRELFTEIVLTSSNLSEVRARLGLKGGGAYATIKKYAELYQIEIPVDRQGQTLKARQSRTLPNDQVFCENSIYTNRRGLKSRLLAMGWEEVCECGQDAEWNGKRLVLQLDHKNGISSDNRIENLRFLCPNCHSQTETYAGKNSSKAFAYPSQDVLEEMIWLYGWKETADRLGCGVSSLKHKMRRLRSNTTL